MKFILFIFISSYAFSFEKINDHLHNIIYEKTPNLRIDTTDRLYKISILKSFWIRRKNLTIPIYQLQVKYPKATKVSYQQDVYLSQKNKKEHFVILHVSPFIDNKLTIENKVVASFKITNSQIYQDKSCDKVSLKIKNIESLLIGCHFVYFKNVKKLRLYVRNQNNQNYTAYLKPHNDIKFNANIISVNFKEKIKNLSFAVGIGPYILESSYFDRDLAQVSTAAMLYGNYAMTKNSSIRGFSASVLNTSKFHNFGLYLANDFAHLDQGDLIFTSLLGVQYLDYNFNSNAKKYSEPLYPQGIEFTYRRLFENKNYIISGGIFINPKSDSDYQNAWLRWGEKYYWEINYINWLSDEFKVTTYGLSLIFPISKFF